MFKKVFGWTKNKFELLRQIIDQEIKTKKALKKIRLMKRKILKINDEIT